MSIKKWFQGVFAQRILFAFLLFIASSQTFAQLSGTYTVGSGENYITLTAAVADLNSIGVSGVVVFELTDASYTTSETFPITINQITGASATNTITIKPASGVTAEISGDSGGDNTSIIKLYGADYIIIDGSNNGTTSRDLTITNTKTGAWSATIWLASLGNDQGCLNNVIKNCKLSYGTNSRTAAVISFSANSHILEDGGYDNNDNIIENNEIYKCNMGINVIAPSDEKSSGNVIRNNLIGSNNSDDYIDYCGIKCNYQNSIEISGNEVFNVIADSNVYGLIINKCIAMTISKNKIHDIINTRVNSYDTHGIYIYSDVSDPDITISNNMIWHIASPGSEKTAGIYLGSSNVTTGIRLYFNSIYLTPDSDYGLDYSNAYSASLLIGGPTGLDCRNNIFRNSLGEKSGSDEPTSCYAVYVNGSSNPFSISDNNIYYSSSTSDNNYIGGKSSTNYSTLSGWQGFTGDDDNSFNVEPDFTSETNLDLDISNDDGITISGYATDIHEDSRNNPPDIGADEHAGPPVVTTSNISNVTGNCATSGGEDLKNNGYAITSKGVCWSTSSDPTTSNSHTNDGTGTDDYTSSITGLNSTITYYVRAYVTNTEGTSYGNNVEFTTTKNPPGNVLEFDGSNDYVETTLNDLSGSEITIEYWFKGSSTQSAIRQQSGAYIVAGWNDKHILSNDGGTSGIAVGSGAEDGDWHHIAMTWIQNTTNGFKSYLDGTLIEERTSSDTPLPDIDANVFLASSNGSSEFMIGSLEEVRIWNDVRTASEIRENKHLPLNGDEQGLVAYYRFDHISGINLTDYSPNGNEGTLHNMTNDDWVTSTIPLGEGTSITETVSSTGSVTFTDTDVTIDFTAKSSSDEFVVTKINNAPNSNPTGEDEVMDSQYWVIEQFGSGTFTADLHITTSEELTSEDRDNPNRIRCFTRNSNSDETWSLLKSAYTVSASSNTAVFKDINTLSQFIITRKLDVENSSSPGNALEFDGTEDFVNIGNSSDFDLGNTLTIEAWIKPSSLGSRKGVFSTRLNNETGSFQLEVGVASNGTNRVAVCGVNTWVAQTEDNVLSPGEWTHIAYTRTGTGSGTHTIYVNGKAQALISDDPYTFVDNTSGKVLGSGTLQSQLFSGKLDEVCIWNLARTEQQIRENMHRALNGDETGLVGYYQLNETTGGDVNNECSSNNGITINMGNDDWVESTIPIGAGASNSQTAFITGTATLGSLSVTTTDAFDNAVDLFCAEIENSPNTTSGTTGNVLDKYFVLYAFGTPGTFSTDLTFTLEEGFISAADQAAPSNLKLYKRTSTADGDWALETSGTEATSTTVKFEGITSYSQFIIGKEEGVRIQTKIFLEGPYDSDANEMTTSLTLPTTSPYSEDARTVSSIPADITDWVLVELRSTVDGSAVVSKSALLHKDGRIVGDDGTTSYIEVTASAGDYFIVIKHRNHLAVESDEVHPLSTGSSTLYDFTVDASTSYDKYYGGDAAVLETGVYGLYAGDGNQSGIVTNSDKDGIIANLNEAGYYDADTNCSGIVTNSDKDAIIANLNKATSIN
ncbi:LamG domain-containing protein [bacterium]|nr:LamG domain-containing protein [bacterium]